MHVRIWYDFDLWIFLFCRGLLDDTAFHESVDKVIKDAIPFYAQIGDRKEAEGALPCTTSTPPGSPVEQAESPTLEERMLTPITPTSLPASLPTSAKKKSRSQPSSGASVRSKVRIAATKCTVLS